MQRTGNRRGAALLGPLLALGLLASCEAGVPVVEAPSTTATQPARVYTEDDLVAITLTVDRDEVTTGIGQVVKLTAVGTADDGTVIPNLDFRYFADGEQLDSNYFIPDKILDVTVAATLGDLVSNRLTIRVHDPEVVSVDFNLKQYAFKTGEEIKFNINPASAYGRTRTNDTAVSINGEQKKYTLYTIDEPGIYAASVFADGVESPVRMFSVSKRIRYSLSLKADLETARPGDTVHFTATAKQSMTGREITEGTPVIKLYGVGEVGDSYTFETPGYYSFYLEYNGEVSKTVVIEVTEDAASTEEGIFDGFASDLPVFIIDTYGKTIGSMKKAPCTVYVYGNDGDGVTEGQLPDLVTKAEIKVRGQSSAGFPKKQYSLHTIKEDGSNNNLKLCGLPKENDWVLNGSYADKSLIRNSLSQKLLSEVMDYTCRTEYCEVYLRRDNGSLDYIGVYTLIEDIKIDKNRVDIEKLDEEDNHYPEITGGYIVSFDKIKGGENTVDTKLGLMTIVKPSADKITKAQDTYIKDYLKEFAQTLRSDKRDSLKNGYDAYIDPESVAAPLLITELIRNIDGFAISTYFYKDRDGRLTYGPAWDYDLTYGNGDYNDAANPEGWYVMNYTSLSRNLLRTDDFPQRMIDTWHTLRNGILSDESLDAYIDEQVAMIGDAAIARSSARWPDHWNGTYVWPNHSRGDLFTRTHGAEIEKMRTFIHERAAWMDAHIEELYTLTK